MVRGGDTGQGSLLRWEAFMMYWACVFLLIGLCAAGVGFVLPAVALAGVAKVMCVMFLGLAVVSLVAVMTRARVRA